MDVNVNRPLTVNANRFPNFCWLLINPLYEGSVGANCYYTLWCSVLQEEVQCIDDVQYGEKKGSNKDWLDRDGSSYSKIMIQNIKEKNHMMEEQHSVKT